MKIVAPGFEILTEISPDGIKELKQIERIARLCYKSEDKITEDGESAKSMVSRLIKNGHTAMIEHSILSVEFTCDRGISHEIVRHRIASFAQESTRYCNYVKDKFGNEISVIDIATGIEEEGKNYENLDAILAEWEEAMKDAERHYMNMINLGATPQIARSVLPTSTKTGIVMTCNYREWRQFFNLRIPKSAHPQMREITKKLLSTIKELIPIVFDDLEVKIEE